MKKIVDYRIVYDGSTIIDENGNLVVNIYGDGYNFWLDDLVNHFILQGWQPQGGVCSSSASNKFCQAMVKYED